MRLLLAEDDYQLGESLQSALRSENYVVDWERDGGRINALLKVAEYDLMILDLGLPNQSGIDILKTLRKTGNALPVLVITARDTLDDKVAGFDSGADDYLTKPFEMAELLARMRALVRRNTGYKKPLISIGEAELDPNRRLVFLAGEQLDLTAKEFTILEMLMLNQGKFISKKRLLESMYSWDDNIESNTVEVYISRLRKVFGNEFIQTLRGVGYRVGGSVNGA